MYKFLFVCIFCFISVINATQHTYINMNSANSSQNNQDNNASQNKVFKLSLDEFAARIEQNSLKLIQDRAMKESILRDNKSMKSWDNAYVELAHNRQGGKNGSPKSIDNEVLLMLAPRLPWVSIAMNSSYKTKLQYLNKTYELDKNLILIAAKRMYLDYLMAKEHFKIYEDRHVNAAQQLEISQKQLDAGRISKAQYLFFQSDFLAAGINLENAHANLLKSLALLKVTLGIEENIQDIQVSDIGFNYIRINDIQDDVAKSPYLDIIDLEITNLRQEANIALHNSMDGFEIGAGGTFNDTGGIKNNALNLKLKVPIPLTTKHYHKRKSFLALQQGAIEKKNLMFKNLTTNITSLKEQLRIKHSFVALARSNEENKRDLSRIIKIGYDSGKISTFEYLSVRNDYLNAMVATVEAKRDYIITLSLLEEALGRSLGIDGLADNDTQKESK